MSKTRENEERQASCCRAKNDHKSQSAADNLSESTIATADARSSLCQSIDSPAQIDLSKDTSTASGESKQEVISTSKQQCDQSKDILTESNHSTNPDINGNSKKSSTTQNQETIDLQNSITSIATEEQYNTSSPSRCQCANMVAKDKALPEWKGIWVDGKPFACVACHRGHRRGNCKHVDRLLVPSASAGRPKGTGANSRKKIKVSGRIEKCDCPAKTCDCEGQCNCRPVCYCTRRSFAIVYISGPTEEKPSFQPDMYRKGRFMIKHETWADLDGEEITDEERNRRETIKAQLIARESQSGLLTPAASGLSLHNTPSTAFSSQNHTPKSMPYATPSQSIAMPELEPAFDFNSPPTGWPPFNTGNHMTVDEWNHDIAVQEPAHGHSNFTIPQEQKFQLPSPLAGSHLGPQNPLNFTASTPQDALNLFESTLTPGNQTVPSAGCCTHRRTVVENPTQPTQQGCNCGDMCKCFGCPQHPRNDQTRLHVQQIYNTMASQNLPIGNFQYGPTAGLMSQSCMGNSYLAYAQHDSLDAATYAAAQQAPSSTSMMLVYQANENNQYSDAMVHTRIGTDWVYQQPPQQQFQQPFEHPPQPVSRPFSQPIPHMEEQQFHSIDPTIAPTDSSYFDFEQASQPQTIQHIEEQALQSIDHADLPAGDTFLDTVDATWLEQSLFPLNTSTHMAATYS